MEARESGGYRNSEAVVSGGQDRARIGVRLWREDQRDPRECDQHASGDGHGAPRRT